MVLNVSSLLKTVKAVEDEHTRGTRAMEATVEAISQEIKVFVTQKNNNFVIEMCNSIECLIRSCGFLRTVVFYTTLDNLISKFSH